MLEPWRLGRFVRIENETPTTKRFWIQVPESATFEFNAGQFVTLDLPISEDEYKRLCSYSIASAPDGSNIFELIVVFNNDGGGTSYLFNEAKAGTEVMLRGPQGVFNLPQVIDKDLFFICTGTGIAPFRSMINYIHQKQVAHKKLYLIFGCRKIEDALYSKEFRTLEKELSSFNYFPTYSRERSTESILTGYVHNVYEKILMENNNDAYFFLCGWRNMIEEAKQRITGLGYEKTLINTELYG